jgi:galactofuranose transport system ATP-binding protein
MSVVFISAELEEILRLSDRIAVLRDRKKIAEIPNDDDVNLETVVGLIAGGAQAS